jgi:L-idonate 5-dehydrogenase
MESLACVIHNKMDLRIEKVLLGALGETQVSVRVLAGGICGSDLHYYLDGGFGTVRIKEPMILGHKVSGTVEALGSEVTKVNIGDHISLNPSHPCGHCTFCKSGQQQHCLDMWFYGSAMRVPHSQGAFRERLITEEFQRTGRRFGFVWRGCVCRTSCRIAACGEPGRYLNGEECSRNRFRPDWRSCYCRGPLCRCG